MHRRISPRKAALSLLLGLAAMALGGCGGDGSTAATASLPTALVGDWIAGPPCAADGCTITAHLKGSSVGLPLTDSLQLDLTLRQPSSVTSTLYYGALSRTLVGTGHTQGNTLIVDYSGTPSDTIAYAMDGSHLRFDFQNLLLLDVTGDGTPDSLQISVVFNRR